MKPILKTSLALLLASSLPAAAIGIGIGAAPATPGATIAAWSLDEGRGRDTLEAVSTRRDPVSFVFNEARYKPNSDPQWRAAPACIKGGCLLFDGYSTDIEAAGLTAQQIAAGWTVSAWVAPHAFEWGDGGQYSGFVSQYDEQARSGFSFGMYRFGSWGIKLGLGVAEFDLRVNDRKLPKDRWSHVAASYEPRSRRVQLFLDGELVASGAAKEGAFTLPARGLTIGRHSEPRKVADVFEMNTFLGLMDEVRIEAGARDAATVAASMRADLAARGGKAPQLARADLTIDAAVFDGDRHRPQYHAMPDFGWMNEPHGAFYYQGQYHLFFQKNPFGPF